MLIDTFFCQTDCNFLAISGSKFDRKWPDENPALNVNFSPASVFFARTGMALTDAKGGVGTTEREPRIWPTEQGEFSE